jgi:hypothetical protein
VTVTCPQGTKATGGGTKLGDDYSDYVQGSYPTGSRGWTVAGFTFEPSGGPGHVVTAHVICLKKGGI